jgi:hypothetical protein
VRERMEIIFNIYCNLVSVSYILIVYRRCRVTGTVPAGSQRAFAVFSSPRLIISLYNMFTFWLASILRKLGSSTSGISCTLHNSREPTTMAVYLNIVFYTNVKDKAMNNMSCLMSLTLSNILNKQIGLGRTCYTCE